MLGDVAHRLVHGGRARLGGPRAAAGFVAGTALTGLVLNLVSYAVVILVILILVAFFVHELAVPLIFCWFAFVSPLRAAWSSLVIDRLRLYKPRRV